MGEAIIQVRDLRKSYGAVQALRGITLDVRRGEVFGILGPNGAGKTTTLEIIEGMRRADSGQVLVDGIDVGREPQRVKARIGIQLQKTGYFDRLNLIELLRLMGELYERRLDPMTLLDEVGLRAKAKARAKQLSGGQLQRFSIAAALVNDPDIIFLDEPTTGLDPHARQNLWRLVRSQNERGRTVVLTTHYIEEAEALCQRVAIMDEGAIVAMDSPASMIEGLLAEGFTKEVERKAADLEDVFLALTGKTIDDDAA